MKITNAVMALALLVPVAGNAAKDHSIELKCEKIKVTLYDKMGAIRSYECSNPVEKVQAMPNIQSIGEMRGQ
ncbi:hypothetical protein QCJ92_00010910 [Enterobacter roggenkampii]|uniref:hypothetical protein n=1 Tax=Enterobacter roggenkampii TaxID=1812935 RepID=UPI0030652093|nr:hypothetical protein [Enterobacter roggenkampii]